MRAVAVPVPDTSRARLVHFPYGHATAIYAVVMAIRVAMHNARAARTKPSVKDTIADWVDGALRMTVGMYYAHTCRVAAHRLRGSLWSLAASISEDDDLSVVINEDAIRSVLGRLYSSDSILYAPNPSISSTFTAFADVGLRKAIPLTQDLQVCVGANRNTCEKKFRLLQGIYKAIESERSKLESLIILIRQGDVDGVSAKLGSWRAITKSAFHLFHTMPLNFLMYMLLWTETIDGADPHQSVVRAKPMFDLLLSRIDKDAAEQRKSPASSTSGRKAGRLSSSGGSGSNYTFLRNLVAAIERCETVEQCAICAGPLLRALTGSGALTPSITAQIDRCPVAAATADARRKVQNLNKSVSKQFSVDGDPHNTSSTSPIIKHIVGMISLAMQTATQPPCARRTHQNAARIAFAKTSPMTRSVLHLPTLRKPFDKRKLTAQAVALPRSICDLEGYTVEPLTPEELLSIPDAKSLLVSVFNPSHPPVTFSIHKAIFPTASNPDRELFVVTDSFPVEREDHDTPSVTAHVSDSADDICRQWRGSVYGTTKGARCVASACTVDVDETDGFLNALRQRME